MPMSRWQVARPSLPRGVRRHLGSWGSGSWPGYAKRFVAPGLVLVIAAVGYWTLFQGTRQDPESLSSLVIERPGLAGLKTTPSSSKVVTPSETGLSELKEAHKNEPDQTGAYSRTWVGTKNTKNTGSALSVLVGLLPTASDAQLAQEQVLTDYTNAKTLKAEDVTVTSRFSVATVPHSRGVAYRESGSGRSGNGNTVVFNVGRVVAVVYTETTSTSRSLDEAARSVVRQESSLLEDREPGFSMSEATRSLGASLLYGLIALGVAAAVFFLPPFLRRVRARRQSRQAAQVSRGHQGRGSKVLRRHKVSPLMQANQRPTRSSRLSSKR
jgi:hypothetical protein